MVDAPGQCQLPAKDCHNLPSGWVLHPSQIAHEGASMPIGFLPSPNIRFNTQSFADYTHSATYAHQL